jgi:hypothetical protein
MMRDQPVLALVLISDMVVLGALIALIAPLTLGAVESWVGPIAAGPLSTLITLAVCAIPSTVAETYCGVLLLLLVDERHQGRTASVRGAMRAANRRIYAIAGWGLMSGFGGLVLILLRAVR